MGFVWRLPGQNKGFPWIPGFMIRRNTTPHVQFRGPGEFMVDFDGKKFCEERRNPLLCGSGRPRKYTEKTAISLRKIAKISFFFYETFTKRPQLSYNVDPERQPVCHRGSPVA